MTLTHLLRRSETARWFTGLLWSIACWSGPCTISAADPVTTAQEPAQTVHVLIKGREFIPSPARLHAGQETVLVFQNADAELHAFVPIKLLEQVPVHIDGNGAPQFGDHGLARVLIPSDGLAEIRFIPPAPGMYRYRCDLPGHQMLGEILVEASAPSSEQSTKESQWRH